MTDNETIAGFFNRRAIVKKEELYDYLINFNKHQGNKLQCEYFLIRCTRDDIREDDFINFLFSGLIYYSIPYSQIYPENELSPEELGKYLVRNGPNLTTTALDLFRNDKHMGELGELFLFMILESKGILQLLNKMSLKTSGNMYVNGLDGIHVEINEKDEVIVHYGYSKMHKQYSKALNKIFDEVEIFCKTPQRKRHEIFLVKSHIDKIKFGKHTDYIAKLLSPYTRNKENLSEKHSLFMGYQWGELKKRPQFEKILSEHQAEKFLTEIESQEKKIKSKIETSEILKKNAFSVFVLPFEDLDAIRNKFRVRLFGEVAQ